MSRTAPLPGRVAVGLMCAALLAGCGLTPEFDDAGGGTWRPKPEIDQQAGPQPRLPGEDRVLPEEGPGEAPPPGPPNGCDDPDPLVIATCLEPIGAITVLPGGQAALVAERRTGRILRVEPELPPVEVARVSVDPAAGGVTGLALSPTYGEDELIYAYVATAVDQQVVRIAPGDVPKPVLTGIPRSGDGRGALAVDGTGALLVATGDAGDRAAAAAPGSLAGKVLRIDSFGRPAAGNPVVGSPVVASGLFAPTALCPDPLTGSVWLTDAEPARDVLRRVDAGRPLGEPAWSWADRPGVSGCVAAPDRLFVVFSGGRPAFGVTLGPQGAFVGTPTDTPLDRYGRITAAAPGGGAVWLGTSNKEGGTPISSDDRVFVLVPSGGSGGLD